METKVNNLPGQSRNIVYVRPIAVADLPADVRAEAGDAKEIYAVHDENGEQLALVREKGLAFVLARQNNLDPVHVH